MRSRHSTSHVSVVVQWLIHKTVLCNVIESVSHTSSGKPHGSANLEKHLMEVNGDMVY